MNEPIHIQISNYRAIRSTEPVSLELGNDITFLLGKNNVGKSSILRFFSEFRGLFEMREDMRRSNEFTIDANPFRWDAMVHRDAPEEPIRINMRSGGSAWEYELRPAHESTPTKMNVKFTPKIYADDNEAVIRACAPLARSIYFGPIRSTTYSGHSSVQNIITGSQFIAQWAEWAFGENVQQQRAARQVEMEIRHLFGFNQFKLLMNNNRNELLAEYDEGTFKLSELGEGLSHFIIVLGNALIRRPTYIFVDEPENGLHPKLQATFVQSIARKGTHGLVASSHSMALARSVADRVLYCTRDSGHGLRVGKHQHADPKTIVSELLEMSYSQIIETGEQNLLLVEGRTDVKAYRELLKLYELEERYILLTLGGGSFVVADPNKIKEELKELKAINAKSVTVMIDSERQTAEAALSQRHQGFAEVCRELGFHCFLTERRAIENYASQSAVTQVLGPSTKALEPYQKFHEGIGWKKNLNWRLLSKMQRSDLDQTDIGKYLAQELTARAGLL